MSHMAEQFSWVPLPYCSLPRCPFPTKSLALSAHVSPQTIHFQVLDNSPLSGPGRGPPSCNSSSILPWRILMDREAWWPTVHKVAQSQTRLKRLSPVSKGNTKIHPPHPTTPVWGDRICVGFQVSPKKLNKVSEFPSTASAWDPRHYQPWEEGTSSPLACSDP